MRREIHIARLTSGEVGESGERTVRADDLLEGDLPEQVQVLTPFAGGGEGFYFPSPSKATCALEVEAESGNSAETLAARVLGFLFNQQNAIPAECQSDPSNRGALKLGETLLLLDKAQKIAALIAENVRLGTEAASHPLVRGDTFNSQLDVFLTSLKAAFDTLVLAAAAPPLDALKPGFQAGSLAAQTLKAQLDTWLSTRVKTE